MDTYELLEQRYTVHRQKKELIVSRERMYWAHRNQLFEITHAQYYLEIKSQGPTG